MSFRHPIGFPALVVCAVAALACANPPVRVTYVPARVDSITSPPVDLRAGASRVDLTPIPGIPLGGYSTEAKVSRGFWTRLYARSLYLEDASGKSLALVTTDLMIMPAFLVDRVVELLHEQTTGLTPANAGNPLTRIGRENLLLAATETHQSPGNFFDSMLYNAYSSPQEGFDSELFEFLARQITKGIKLAYHERREATLLTSHFTGPTADDYVIKDFVRNRSLDAFLLNREAQSILAANATRLTDCPVTDPDWPGEYPDPRACRAVHARVDLLELLDKTTQNPIALAVFVPAHITVLDAESEVYAGDVFGLSETSLEARMLSDATCRSTTAPAPAKAPVVGVFNGAQGDVSLWWRKRTREQALALSKQLGDHVCNRLAAGLRAPAATPSLGFQFDYIDVSDHKFDDETGYERKTAATPATGSAELGGAEDQRTIFYDLGQKEGRREYARGEQGAKHTPLRIDMAGQKLDVVGTAFEMQLPPRLAPLGIYQIGDVVIVGFPSEPTTTMGLRIRQAVYDQLKTTVGLSSPDQVLLASFSNGHISYVTTPQEFDRQTYEGASNYWGPATGPLLQSEASRLAGDLASGTSAPKAWVQAYAVGAEKIFEPRNTWGPAYDPDEGLANIAVRVSDPAFPYGDPYREFPTFCWRDEIPSLATSGPACGRVVPDVRIHDVSAGKTLEIDELAQDNHGFGFVTVMTAVSYDQTEWCAVWLRPDNLNYTGSSTSPSMCRFEVDRIAGGATVTSDDFACKGPGPRARPHDTSNQLLPPLVPNDGSSLWCKWPFDALGYCSTTCAAGGL